MTEQVDGDLAPLLDTLLDDAHRRVFELQARRRRIEHQRIAAVPFSLFRLIGGMADGRLTGAELEYVQESARRNGEPFDHQRVRVDFETLRRDLNIATANQGGYLKADTPLAVEYDVLRPWSVVVRGGVQILPNLRGDVSVSRTATAATVSWMSSETAAASPSTPTLAQNTLMSPKVAIGVVNISRQLRLQARADAWIARELLRTAGTTLDQAVLSGTGANGQPLGLLNMTTSTQSGTALAWAGITAMKRTAAAANVDDAEIAFLGTPAVRELLEKREKASGSGIVWDGPTMAGCRAYASTDMPSATLLCGPLSRIIVGIWGDGLQVELNPFDGTLFKSGVVQARVLMGVDVAVECDPLAFCKAATIT